MLYQTFLVHIFLEPIDTKRHKFKFQINTLVSIASFTASVSVSINTSIKIPIGSGAIQNRQHQGQCWR